MRPTRAVLILAAAALVIGWGVALSGGWASARWLWLVAFVVLSLPLLVWALVRLWAATAGRHAQKAGKRSDERRPS